MSSETATKIGEVRKIEGSTVTASLDGDLAGAAPLYEGRLREVSQIGTFLSIPRGLIEIVATVSEVGVSEVSEPDSREYQWKNGEWWLKLELIGQVDKGSGQFERGVGAYPEIGDSVHFVTAEKLNAVFPEPDTNWVQFGSVSTNPEVKVTLDLQELVTKHSAIVGSTGSGKTSAVASILQNLVDQGWKNSNIILIDPHGEYSSALEEVSSVLSVIPGENEDQLQVPCWALPPASILGILLKSRIAGGDFFTRFSELVVEQRQELAEEADWLEDIDESSINAETPIPFDIRKVWHTLSYENRETVDEDGEPCEEFPGNPEELHPPVFTDYEQHGYPNQGDQYNDYGNMPYKLRLALQDPRFQFLQEPRENLRTHDPLKPVLEDWLGNENPISILDFSGVPDQATDAAIGVILDLVFEISIRSDENEGGIGRHEPVLIVLEEAHRYLGQQAREETVSAVNQIAKEGRKYGLGLMAVTQRPSEIPETTLAQCGTLVSLRLTNKGDQGTIKAALPDTSLGISNAIPSLRKHEAIVSGEAIKLPSRVFIKKPKPWPAGNDPELSPWRDDPETPSLENILKDWRETYV